MKDDPPPKKDLKIITVPPLKTSQCVMATPTPKILVMDRSLLDQTLGSPTLDNWISEKMLTKEISRENKGLRKKVRRD